MIEEQDDTFLKWFTNILIFRYGIDNTDSNFQKFYSLLNKMQGPISINITEKELDKIICKYYADFYLDKSDSMGFSDEERIKLRQQILDLSYDVVNKNVPDNMDFFIKNN